MHMHNKTSPDKTRNNQPLTSDHPRPSKGTKITLCFRGSRRKRRRRGRGRRKGKGKTFPIPLHRTITTHAAARTSKQGEARLFFHPLRGAVLCFADAVSLYTVNRSVVWCDMEYGVEVDKHETYKYLPTFLSSFYLQCSRERKSGAVGSGRRKEGWMDGCPFLEPDRHRDRVGLWGRAVQVVGLGFGYGT